MKYFIIRLYTVSTKYKVSKLASIYMSGCVRNIFTTLYYNTEISKISRIKAGPLRPLTNRTGNSKKLPAQYRPNIVLHHNLPASWAFVLVFES